MIIDFKMAALKVIMHNEYGLKYTLKFTLSRPNPNF